MPAPVCKSFTFLSRHAPYGRDNAQICLELVLATAVYEQTVNYLFMDDGVYQLVDSQQPRTIHNKTLSANLQALSLYGVETVYVDSESLRQRRLSIDDLVIQVQLLSDDEVTAMIRTADVVFPL